MIKICHRHVLQIVLILLAVFLMYGAACSNGKVPARKTSCCSKNLSRKRSSCAIRRKKPIPHGVNRSNTSFVSSTNPCAGKYRGPYSGVPSCFIPPDGYPGLRVRPDVPCARSSPCFPCPPGALCRPTCQKCTRPHPRSERIKLKIGPR